tara:strand:- start:122 stop:520 length:399 start_codon:yes stop_codon:yes gene_type:complete
VISIYCTYCSAKKDKRKTPMPAAALYQNERIKNVYHSAQLIGVKFMILSGKYGLIDAMQKIKTYDHLLLAAEVDQHADLVAMQMKVEKINEIVFFMNPIKTDDQLKPYLNCMLKACQKSGISLIIKEESYID